MLETCFHLKPEIDIFGGLDFNELTLIKPD